MTNLRELKWWWFLRQNSVPHPEEIRSFYPLKPLITPRMEMIVNRYALLGFSLEEIADEMQCTRERVRQMLLKFRRQNRVGSNL